ncbi:hypothetical protein FRB96_006020 [Tulasnella sp. 330]|nr:hypothetical protein FRB96_006020 [Tulasnella sp. 330]KAG8877747.1 hypothetical protein FRB98_006530 [Tulasnella sp. 332]
MSQISPDTRLVKVGDEVAYRWILTPVERTHIASLLDVDASAITTEGNIMVGDRVCCKSCGKRSGLDDLVHNALSIGVHCKDFMLDVLINGPKADSPAHPLSCSTCGETYEELFLWAGHPNDPWF